MQSSKKLYIDMSHPETIDAEELTVLGNFINQHPELDFIERKRGICILIKTIAMKLS